MTTSATREVTCSWERHVPLSAVAREVIVAFLQRRNWATFGSELGYVLHDSLVPQGGDDSRTIETFLPNAARSNFVYARRKPWINTYGNSFTESNQVSNGETWREYLAAHFGDPVGDYGVGGHCVSHAYGRMLLVKERRTVQVTSFWTSEVTIRLAASSAADGLRSIRRGPHAGGTHAGRR
jgi:hypothetical protein